jgi:nucleoside-triphosphatase THEP1
MKDPIIQEVRAVREKLAARFDFNVKSICENARKNQKKSGHQIVSFAGKRKTILCR